MNVLSEVLHTKRVKYFGIELQVPLSVTYITVDYDGACFGYESEPRYSPSCGRWSDGYNWVKLGEFDLEGMSSADTLQALCQ